ncbi:MAG: HEAT repeat domain-containing protein, partial [Firmicutes bacterium]|nr:HEAT repeat domain-containing protein [Bacillota bacterium]
MNEKQALAILKEPNGSEKLATQAEEAFEICLNLLAQEEPAAAAFLVRVARQKKYREQINKWLGDRKLLYRLLGSDDAKMRKNIARLMGQLLVPEDVLPLAEALEHESKRMVIPSMILALGALKTPQAITALHAYQVKPAQDASEEKHVQAELEALRTALSAFQQLPKHSFKGFSSKMPLELRCGRGLERALAEELTGLDVRDVKPGRVTLAVSKWEELKISRIWREALIPLCRGVEVNTENV